MRVLHICSDFLGTSAHISLFRELDNLGVVQNIFVPIKKNSDTTRNEIRLKTLCSKVYFSRRLGIIDKYLYGLKIYKLLHDIESQIVLTDVDIIHASLLCNEGALAYELSKKYHIPYIVSVRNTDINGYIKTFKWRKGYFRKIVRNACKIVFISAQYPQRLEEALNVRRDNRYIVIHNGLQDYYIEHLYRNSRREQSPVRIVMTGAFVRNKNIHGAVAAVELLRNKGYNIVLAAIGNNLASYNSQTSYASEVMALSVDRNWFSTYEAQPKEQLVESLRSSDIFLLPSFTETFGLSYLEALSQGLPVVFTKGEGFDGTYPEGKVGFSAYASDPQSIANAIEKTIKNYFILRENISMLDFSVYDWRNIAKRYKELYENIVKG